MITKKDIGRIMVRDCGCMVVVSDVEKIRERGGMKDKVRFWELFRCNSHGATNFAFDERRLSCTITTTNDFVAEAATGLQVNGIVRHIAKVQSKFEQHERLVDALRECLDIES